MTNNNAPFHVGQRVVCVVASPCVCGCGMDGLKKNQYYTVLDVSPLGSLKVFAGEPSFYWDNKRFAPIEPRHQEVEIAEELLVEPVEERVDISKTPAHA